MEKPIKSVLAYVDSLKPAGVAMAPAVKNQCIEKFTKMYPSLGKDYASRYYERESDAFTKMVMQSDALRQCTPRSLYFAFMKGMALKLSFDNGRQQQLYLIPGNRKVGEQWIKEVTCQPSPEGEKEVRLSAGILKEVGKPYIVHKGDIFEEEFNTDTGEMDVKKFKPLDKTQEIVASFIRLVEPSGKVVYRIFKPIDWKRWEAASKKKNKDKTNDLYMSGIDGQIDESFLKAKTLLHSFKGYKQVDYIYDNPEGFQPDKEAATQINSNYMEDVYEDAQVIDDTVEQLPDEFTQAVNEAPEEKPSVKVETSKDDDDLFNN